MCIRITSRMKQIPSPGTQAQKLFLLSPLSLWRVPACAKWTREGRVGPHGHRWIGATVRIGAMAQGRAPVVLFIFASRATASSGIRRVHWWSWRSAGGGFTDQWCGLGGHVASMGRWGSRGLVASVVHDAGKEFLSATGHLLDCLLGGAILPWPGRRLGHVTR
jgi:hypothetical protein